MLASRELRVGPFKLFGSPMPGWNTPYVGPVFMKEVEAEDFFAILEEYLSSNSYKHAELIIADSRYTERNGYCIRLRLARPKI